MMSRVLQVVVYSPLWDQIHISVSLELLLRIKMAKSSLILLLQNAEPALFALVLLTSFHFPRSLNCSAGLEMGRM